MKYIITVVLFFTLCVTSAFGGDRYVPEKIIVADGWKFETGFIHLDKPTIHGETKIRYWKPVDKSKFDAAVKKNPRLEFEPMSNGKPWPWAQSYTGTIPISEIAGLKPKSKPMTGGDSFTIVTRTPNAAAYDKAAEDAYARQSKYWFGKSHPELYDKCEITIRESRNGGNGGMTRFSFGDRRSSVYGWKMMVQGTRSGILNDTIPHEVNHVVFAAKFGKPLPRLFDEGASVLFEGPAEHARNAAIIHQSFQLRDGIPARQMIDAMSYPSSGRRMAVFYAQSYFIVRYLVQEHGPKKLIAFLEDSRRPSAKLQEFYGLTPERLDAAWLADFRGTATTRTVAAKSSRICYVFTDPPNCPPCRSFARDENNGVFRGYKFKKVYPGTHEWAKAAAEYKQYTGRTKTGTVPVFWVYKTRTVYKGYSRGGLLRWLLVAIPKAIINAISGILTGDKAIPDETTSTPPTGPVFNTQDVSVVDGTPVEDWSGVQIVVLAAEQDVGLVKGRFRKALIGISRGRLERKISGLTKGKALVHLVAERTDPEKYDAVLKAAGLEPQAFDVLVLIPKTNKGLVKGLIIKKIESVASEKLKGVPIEPIFERGHAGTYAGILAALQVKGVIPVPFAQRTISEDGIEAVAVNAAKSAAIKFLADKLPDHVKNLIPKPTESLVTVKEERDELRDNIVFGSSGAGIGSAAMFLANWWWRRKRDKNIIEQVKSSLQS